MNAVAPSTESGWPSFGGDGGKKFSRSWKAIPRALLAIWLGSLPGFAWERRSVQAMWLVFSWLVWSFSVGSGIRLLRSRWCISGCCCKVRHNAGTVFPRGTIAAASSLGLPCPSTLLSAVTVEWKLPLGNDSESGAGEPASGRSLSLWGDG